MDKVMYCARHRIPQIFTPCPIGGGTAPATGAGELIQAAAESWLGLVVSQLLNPGTPFFMGAVVSIMDMRATVLAYGAPELSLFQAGLTELARYVGLPVWSTGGCTDSKAFDEQAALEGTLSILFSGLSGADLIHDVGFVEGAIAGSLQQVVLMDEVISMVKRIMRGITVDDESLAVDVIHRVRPGGHYLADEHTFKHFKSEFWFPSLIDRNRWEDWRAAGGKSMRERVQEKLNHILETHEISPALPPAAREKIEAILAGAEKRPPEN
jgi:trimethylamine--corrinoid protein Co-methyltransferase